MANSGEKIIENILSDRIVDRMRNIEPLTLVYLNDSTNINDVFKSNLYNIIDYMKTFDSDETCEDFISTVETEDVFLVISSNTRPAIISKVHDKQRLHSIYIYKLSAKSDESEEEWLSEYTKVKGVFSESNSLIEELSINVKLSIKSLNELNGYTSNEVSDSSWFILLMNALIGLNRNNNDRLLRSTKQSMINQFRIYYQNNKTEQINLDNFQQNYQSNDAVGWYTRDTFLFRTLNKALRQHDIDIIFLFLFFIVDLWQQLKLENEKQTSNQSDHSSCNEHNNIKWMDNSDSLSSDTISNVNRIFCYRGQLMSKEEIEKFQMISFFTCNSFMSTTLNYKLALMFAGQHSRDDNIQSVIFSIETPSILLSQTPYANISHLSHFGESEKEILFMVGTPFRKRFVVYEEDAQHWQVSLTLVSDNPNELYDDDEHPYEYSSFEMPSIYKSLSVDKPADIKLLSAGLSLLFCNDNPSNERKLSNPHEMAEKYYNLFLNDNNNSVSYTGLAIVAHQRGEYEKTFYYLYKALDTCPSSNLTYVIYCCMGNVYREKSIYDKALDYYTMALTKKQDTKLDLLVEQDLYQFNNLFKVLWNLSLIHKINGNYELAWDTYKQYLTSEAYVAHDCYLDMLIRETYALLVSTCPKQAEWDEQMMSKIKFIDASSLDADKYSDVIADAYKDIISEYLDKNKADLGKELLTKALDSLTGKSLEQLYAPLQYENIGDNYQEQNQFDLAAECYEKSLSLELESAHRNDSHQIRFDMRVFVKTLKCRTNSSNFQLAIDFSKKISADYINAGMTLHEVINLYTALVDFDQENNVTVNENDRIEWYNKLGEYNSKIGDVYKSNVWYKKILHHDDANIWANIAYNYNQINDYKLAIYHYKKALECSLKIRDRDLIACICFGLASSFSRLPNKKNVAIDHYKRALLFCTATEELSTFVDPNSVHNTVIAINRQTGDNFKSAAQFYTKTIHLCLKNKLNTHKEIASAHKAFYLAYGDKQTVEFYKAVIDIYEQQIRMVEDDLHDLLTIYKYLACIYEKNGNFQLAIDLFRKWQAHSKFIRHNDIEYGLLCFKIATLYDKLDEDSTAIEHYQEGLTLLRNGSNIPDASCLPVVCNIMDQF